jgi:hypothetical protein
MIVSKALHFIWEYVIIDAETHIVMKKQNVSVLIIIVVVLVFLGMIGYLYYVKGQQKKPVVHAINESTASATVAAPKSTTINLNNILLSGKNQKCTLQKNGTNQTYYMHELTVRVDLASSTSRHKVSFLADGEDVYIWAQGSKNGVSIPEQNTNAINSVIQKDGIPGFDINAVKNLKCTPWVADYAVLGAPNSVNFTPYKK